MRASFDRRVVPEYALGLVRACQARVRCRLAGGAALSGAYLAHRLSADIDLFTSRVEDIRALVRDKDDVAAESGTVLDVVRDAGGFVRLRVVGPQGAPSLELDLVHEASPELDPSASRLEGVVIQSLTDLRASKLACILERSEPRDLVDLLFLERAGFPPERDVALALRKDAGMDPGVLAWLLGQFPVEPLPSMLVPLGAAELLAYRNDLANRFRVLALAAGEGDRG